MFTMILMYAVFPLIKYAYIEIKKSGKAYTLKEPEDSTLTPYLKQGRDRKDPYSNITPTIKEYNMSRASGMVITIPPPSLPLHQWDFRLLPPPRYFPWHQVINSPVIDKKYLQAPYAFMINEDFDLSELEIPDGPMARRIARHHHTCLTADLICVYYTTPYLKNDINARRQGILTICPNCKRQVGFNGTMMN